MKKVTIKDVADAAGVSYVTVSNVINSKGRMTEETRKKVLACIKKMDFHPDGSARALVSGKSNTIAYISGYLSSPFVTGVLKGVEQQLYDTENSGYILAHISTNGMQSIKKKLLDEMIYGKKADAVIMITVMPDDKQIREFKKAGIPLVLIENSAASGVNSIRMDNCKGAYLAVDHMLKKGRKKIAIINGQRGRAGFDEVEIPCVGERLKGYKDALKNSGIEPEEKRIFYIEHYFQEQGMNALDSILAENPDTDAIFCAAGDVLAFGVIYRAKQLGINIPGDISLVGFDDVQIAGIINPALTTVKQPLDEMGRKAFDLAMGAMTGKIHGTHEIMLAPELMIREST